MSGLRTDDANAALGGGGGPIEARLSDVTSIVTSSSPSSEDMLRAPRPYCEASKATSTISLKLGVVDNEKLNFFLLDLAKKVVCDRKLPGDDAKGVVAG